MTCITNYTRLCLDFMWQLWSPAIATCPTYIWQNGRLHVMTSSKVHGVVLWCMQGTLDVVHALQGTLAVLYERQMTSVFMHVRKFW